MSKISKCYGVGQALFDLMPPPLFLQNPPTSTQTNYSVGQIVFTGAVGAYAFYIYAGNGVWEEFIGSAFGVSSVNGTPSQILASPTTGAVVLSLIGPYTPATYTAHGVLIGEGTSSIVATTPGTDGQVLTGNTGADPTFSAIGTKSGLTAHGVLIAEGASAFAVTSAGSAGQLLTSGGASADPTWTTATFPSTVGATGTILRSDGTNWVASTDTYPDTVVAGDIVIATAANVIGSLADVATGQVLMSGGVGVAPAYSGSPSVTGTVTAATGLVATAGNLSLNGVTSKININASTAATASLGTTSALTGGAITVSTTAITANSLVFFTTNTLGTITAPGSYRVSARTPGVSFDIQSSSPADTSTVDYWIIN